MDKASLCVGQIANPMGYSTHVQALIKSMETIMTLGFSQWLNLLAPAFRHSLPDRSMTMLDPSRLSCRDVQDLNLPYEVVGRRRARQDAEDLRRRAFW
jgi:hypothetical protein